MAGLDRKGSARREVDAVIVGGGPAGLAVAHTFQRAGIETLVLEKGPLASHIAQYPTFMRFFSTNENLEIDGFPLQNTEDKPTRQQYLEYLTAFARFHQLAVETYAEVVAVKRDESGRFAVDVRRPGGVESRLAANAVVLAVGAWESPRRLDCPGAGLPKVIERFREAHDFIGRRVLVVGGRNSAIETALLLHRAGARVSLSYRGRDFTGRGIKYWLLPDIQNRIKFGEISGYLETEVAAIDWESATLRRSDGRSEKIANDFVIPCLGYDPPVGFLRDAGIAVEPGTNIPSHDEATLETNVPGLFVAGTIVAGNVSGRVFIENSRHHGEMMLGRVRELCGPALDRVGG